MYEYEEETMTTMTDDDRYPQTQSKAIFDARAQSLPMAWPHPLHCMVCNLPHGL